MSDLPRALPTLWRSMRYGYAAEPGLIAISIALEILAAVPDALFALWLKLLVEGVADGRDGLVLSAALGLAGSTVGGWMLQTIGYRIQRTFRLRLGVKLEARVAELQASIPTIEHQERPAHLNRLAVLREETYQLDHMYQALFDTMGALIRLGVVVVLLASVHPVLALLALFAVPTAVVSSKRAGALQRALENTAPAMRLARHLFLLGTTSGPAKEIRLAGIGDNIITERRAAWVAGNSVVAATRWVTAIWQAGSWLLFGAAYAGAVAYAAWGLDASAGSVLLVLAAGSRMSQYVGATAGSGGMLRTWLDASQRLGWLEHYATAHHDDADRPVPDRLRTGIRLEHVSFRYPDTERTVLDDVSLDLPAGAVVAIVGENGAGKSTLIKLLSRFYAPTSGRITIDGTDLARLPAEQWRARMSGAYQDFFSFEYPALRSISVGDLTRLDEVAAVTTAVQRGGANDVIDRLPQGLQTQLGRTWPDGVELSFGQWQKLALARGFMRDDPLVLVLDEPTAALDAETEHALFERYAERARTGADSGRITILVSHRFSTVRMADLIVVLDGARVVEVGGHDDLIGRGGTYAELYGIQAAAYR